LLVTKKEPVTNLKILVYRCPGEVERLTKIMEHADVQLVQCMQQIKNLVAEKDICNKELADLKTAAQAVVDMVDPPEGSVEEGRTLLERLQAGSSTKDHQLSLGDHQAVLHVLGLVKSYWPEANLNPLGEGMALECDEEKFATLVEEVKHVADKIVDALEQGAEA